MHAAQSRLKPMHLQVSRATEVMSPALHLDQVIQQVDDLIAQLEAASLPPAAVKTASKPHKAAAGGMCAV